MSGRDLKLAIWDVDGTLIDSRAVIAHAMDEAFSALGLEPPGYDRTRHIVGLSLDVACKTLAPEGLSAGDLERLTEAYKAAFVAHRADPVHAEPLYDGALALVEELSAGGWALAIATGKARRGVDAFFAQHPAFEAAFDSVHCADDGPGKPHPFMVEQALLRWGAPPSRAVMIGDTGHDMAMARAARVRALGVTWGFHTREEIAAAGADEIHETMESLARALRAFASGPGVAGRDEDRTRADEASS